MTSATSNVCTITTTKVNIKIIYFNFIAVHDYPSTFDMIPSNVIAISYLCLNYSMLEMACQYFYLIKYKSSFRGLPSDSYAHLMQVISPA